MYFKQLRNKCTVSIRKIKAEYFLDKTTENATNSNKFWKSIRFLTDNGSASGLPYITKGSVKIVDKVQLLNSFNSHFTVSGSLSKKNNYVTVNSEFLNAERPLWTTEFVFNHINYSDVFSALKKLFTKFTKMLLNHLALILSNQCF